MVVRGGTIYLVLSLPVVDAFCTRCGPQTRRLLCSTHSTVLTWTMLGAVTCEHDACSMTNSSEPSVVCMCDLGPGAFGARPLEVVPLPTKWLEVTQYALTPVSD